MQYVRTTAHDVLGSLRLHNRGRVVWGEAISVHSIAIVAVGPGGVARHSLGNLTGGQPWAWHARHRHRHAGPTAAAPANDGRLAARPIRLRPGSQVVRAGHRSIHPPPLPSPVAQSFPLAVWKRGGNHLATYSSGLQKRLRLQAPLADEYPTDVHPYTSASLQNHVAVSMSPRR